MNIFKTILLSGLLFSAYYVPAGFLTYNTDLITLSNGNHTIAIQGMVHIAPKEFYTETENNISYYKDKKYNYYFEQVEIESEEELKQWKQKTGDTSDIVYGISSVLNFDSQSNYKEINNGIKADIKMKDILKTIKKDKLVLVDKEDLKQIKEVNNDIKENNYFDTVKDSWIHKEFLKSTMRIAFRKVEFFGGREDFEKVIIEKRNNHLLKTIDYNKDAFITYGQLHLNDIIEKLESKGYKIIKESKVEVF